MSTIELSKLSHIFKLNFCMVTLFYEINYGKKYYSIKRAWYV